MPWFAIAGFVLLASVFGANLAQAATDNGDVHVVDISGNIDLGLAPYLERALDDAQAAGASAVLLDINTPGGRLDAVLQMQSSLVDAPVRTVAFVDGMALSAGALITIAAEDVYIAPGSTLGAATPVLGPGEQADEKTVSAVRSTFAATAEVRGRDPRVAEAMVDPDVEVEGLIEAGKLLTLDSEGALEWGYADGIAQDRAAALQEAGLGDAELVETAPSFAESLVRFLTNPVVSPLLMTLAMWLLIADLVTGGIGIATGVAVVFFAIFFWGHMLAGLTGWEDMALVAVGLGLIALELLVFPGFGLPGLLGLAAVFGGLFLAQLSRDLVTPPQVQRAALSVGLMFLAVVIGLVLAVRFLGRHGPPRALVLETQVGKGEPIRERAVGGWVRWFGGHDLILEGGGAAYDEDEEDYYEPESLLSREGVALSDLRPSGVAEVDGDRVDVVTAGEYISAGERIEVVRDEGYRRVVRRLSEEPA